MQYTNIIGIDPSTTCTGICINGKPHSISPHDSVYTKKGTMTKWYNLAEEAIELEAFDKTKHSASFEDSEIEKITLYDSISDSILSIINKKIKKGNTICVIEGFSYNGAAGHLIDLVTFSTLLRYKILKNTFHLKVVPPATLKVLSAKMTYTPIDVGKKKPKYEWRNHDGVSGGKFTKHDMLSAVKDNDTLKDEWALFVKEHFSDLYAMKDIPKPFEDVNDAYLLYKTHLLNNK